MPARFNQIRSSLTSAEINVLSIASKICRKVARSAFACCGILDAVSAQNRVEAQDDEGGEHRQPAHPLKARGQGVVCADGALAGFPAHGQLGHHDAEANEDGQQQIDDQEREAAGLAHFIGEAPDVAQAHGRADGGH